MSTAAVRHWTSEPKLSLISVPKKLDMTIPLTLQKDCQRVKGMQRNDKTNFRTKLRINFPAQHFQKVFQIGFSRFKQCGSSREALFSPWTSKLW